MNPGAMARLEEFGALKKITSLPLESNLRPSGF
jgi:hypothetical protein